MAYCTNAQAILFFDSTLLGQLVNDDGTQATEAELATNAKLTAALAAASGEINMAARVSDRYETTDLSTLTGDDAVKLQELCAWLAIPRLLGRRNPALQDYPEVDEAREMLGMIREGVRIFNVAANAESGLPSMVDNQSSRTRPFLSSYCRAGRFFGIRAWSMPNCVQGPQSGNGGCC